MAEAGFRRIAVATDGSETAGRAVKIAADLARRYGADLLVVAVAPLPSVLTTAAGTVVPPPIVESPLPRYRALVEDAVEACRKAGVPNVTGVADEGAAVDGILAQVKAHGSDLLVVGSRGLSTAARLLLGSVSTALVTQAPCPVLVVRSPTTPAKSGRAR